MTASRWRVCSPTALRRSAVLSGALLLLAPGGAKGQDQKAEVRLPDIVLSATRTETPTENAPASVTVVNREDVQRLNVSTVDEALRFETGVEIKRSKSIADTTPRVQMRGLYGQNRTLFLVDGLPVNSGYTGDVPLTTLALDSIEHIEVIRGPGSALYGGNAMAGVVNIVTRRPTALEGALRLGYGSDDTRRLFANLGGRPRPSLGVRLGFEHETTDGYANTPASGGTIGAGTTGTLTGGYETTSVSGKRQYVIGDTGDNWARRNAINLQTDWDAAAASKLKLDLQVGRHDYGYARPHSYLLDPAGATAWKGDVALGAGGEKSTVAPASFLGTSGTGREDFGRAALSLDQALGDDILLAAKAGYQRNAKWYTSNGAKGDQDFDTAPGNLSDATSNTWLADLQMTYSLGQQHVLTAGTTFKLDDYDQASYGLTQYRDADSKTDKLDITQGRDRFHSLYVQEEWRPWRELAVYAGVRYDHWRSWDGRAGNVGAETDFGTHADFAFSPKASVVFTPWEQTTLRTSAGRAFRAPTIYDLFRTWKSGSLTYHSNAHLKPETLWNGELGAEQRLWTGRVRLAATAFYSRLYDAITTYTVAGTDNYKDNLGRAGIKGAEVEAELRPVKGLRLWTNASLVDAKVLQNDRNPDSVGKKMTNVANELVNVGGQYRLAWIRLDLGGNYRGRIYTSELNTDRDDVYGGYSQRWLWNGKLTATPNKHVDLSFAVDSIFNSSYFDYYTARGRSFFVEATGRL